MFRKNDERFKSAKTAAIRYTYLFQLILIILIFITSNIYKGEILLYPIYLFNSLIHISISLNRDVSIIASTQILVLFITQALFNKRFGGTLKPLVSGNNKFRFMDERERIISDKSTFITFIYTNIFFIVWTIFDILLRTELELSFIILVLEFAFYIIIKSIILYRLGEKIQ
ncbi:hypothetical protein [Clostridium sp.]|jgi:hypothetical protein|uniref:hypothetical protein n=1 Tax=Clostridium sp. TaxID=1506 RepID=UPI0025880561|nr:hypothetical protein [Clostridium sp.]MDF2504108.1 hypothetical protein [Clostridium sp.]